MNSQTTKTTTEQKPVDKLAVRYVNAGDTIAARIMECNQRGLTVVNATRPMSGDEDWQGPFFAGIFYVAGDAERWAQHWLEYDGKRLEVVTNAQVLQAVIEKSKERKISSSRLKGLLAEKGPNALKDFARQWLDMPYVPAVCEDFAGELAAATWPKD